MDKITHRHITRPFILGSAQICLETIHSSEFYSLLNLKPSHTTALHCLPETNYQHRVVYTNNAVYTGSFFEERV